MSKKAYRQYRFCHLYLFIFFNLIFLYFIVCFNLVVTWGAEQNEQYTIPVFGEKKCVCVYERHFF